MIDKELKAFGDAMHNYGVMAIKAAEIFLHERNATSVYVRVISHFNFGGELCDGPYAMLRASFNFKAEDLMKLLGDEELASIRVKRYDVPGFNDGVFQGVADIMYSYKKDKAYFFGG